MTAAMVMDWAAAVLVISMAIVAVIAAMALLGTFIASVVSAFRD